MKKIKLVLFSLIPILILLVTAELALRSFYYQKHADYAFAITHVIVKLRDSITMLRARQKVENTIQELDLNSDEQLLPKEVRAILSRELYSERGKKILASFQREYEENFKNLAQEVKSASAKLLVLYIPAGDYKNSVCQRDTCRNFYRKMAKKYNTDYLDLTETFLKYPVEWITLLPEDAHPSRFGNIIVADNLSNYIEKYTDYRSEFVFDQRPKLFGDMKLNRNEIKLINPTMPYRVITNSQGLRMEYNLEFPKQKQRILILGDSVTFGPYLDNHHVYPNLLDKKYQRKEIINAGKAGYTITDETSLFLERAKYVEPDIVILQVLDNDIFGLFYFKQNEFDRKRRKFKPSKTELEFFDAIKKSL